MRRFMILARTAAMETLAEPLTAVLFLSGLGMVHLAPVFHYHQLGAAGRLARECGFSALLVFGLVFATAAAVRIVGRELQSGTAAVALALSVPRALFFTAKVTGVLGALLLFASATAAATALSHDSSVIASIIRQEHGSSTQAWGPALAAGVGFTLSAFAFAAAANRFFRLRFCLSACCWLALAQPVALIVAAIMAGRLPPECPGFGVALTATLPAFAVLFAGCGVFVVFAAALATRLQSATCTALAAAAVISAFIFPLRFILPDLNFFWQVNELVLGGAYGWREALPALAAAAALMAFWFIVGSVLLAGREIS